MIDQARKPPRKPLIAGNWKMNGTLESVSVLARAVVDGCRGTSVDVVMMPAFPHLAPVARHLDAANPALGAQDLSPHPDGARTGDVSAAMLVDLGVRHVLVGHSERRLDHAEDNAIVASKFSAALSAGLVPVLCVGETLQQREAGRTEAVIAAQFDAVAAKVGTRGLADAVIAYEPVWAIGTGRTATPEQAQAIHAFIRSRIAQLDATIAGQIRILYGGSMKPQNASELLACDDIDGGLIGGASLVAGDFLAIVSAAASR